MSWEQRIEWSEVAEMALGDPRAWDRHAQRSDSQRAERTEDNEPLTLFNDDDSER